MKHWQFAVLILAVILSIPVIAGGVGIIFDGDDMVYDFLTDISGDVAVTHISNSTAEIRTAINGSDTWLNSLGIGTESTDSILHIKANTPGTVGSHDAGQLIIQDPDDTVLGVAVITGYESDGAGNPDQQLWYLGSQSGGNSDIIFLNRRNSKLHLGTNGIVRMTIDSGATGGSVGIGTESPNAKLEVKGNVRVFESAGDPRILVGDNASSGQWGGLDWDSTSDYLQIINSGYSGSDGVINILSSGKVGIGTTTPNQKLQIIGGLNQTNGNATINMIYGETNIHPDGNITVIINIQNVHENITGFNESVLNGFSLQGNDTLIAEVSGRYSSGFWVSSSGGVNRRYEVCITINGIHTTPHAHARLGSSGDISSMAGGGIVDLEVGDQINLQILNADGTQDVDIFFAGMRFVRIGDI